jgi:hypothetical protein
MLNWLIPFFLGLISSLFIDFWRSFLKRRKLKNFTLQHLEFHLLPEVKELKSEYAKVKEYILEVKNEKIPVKVFEALNSRNLEAADIPSYYDIFGSKFNVFNDIKHTLDFLQSKLPFNILDDYFDIVNTHLKEKDKVGDMLHVKNCSFCIDCRIGTIKTIDLRIIELDKLENKILKLIHT